MPFVRRDSYNPGTVHLLNGTVVRRNHSGWPTRDDDTYGHVQGFDETALGVCGQKISNRGYESERPSPIYPKQSRKYGGLRVSDRASLNTKDICARCRKVILDGNPELKAAFEMLSKVKA